MKPLRWCWHALIVPDSQGRYRIVLVIENVAGFHQLRSPVLRTAAASRDLRRAECQASAFNRAIGVSEDDATRIVFSSLRKQRPNAA